MARCPSDFYSAATRQSLMVLPLGTEVVTPLCAPELAPEIRAARDLLGQTLLESETKKVRWPAWFAANGMVAPAANGPRFDRSFLSLSAAADGLGVALESTLLAERELASGRLVRPLQGVCEDVVYTGHWLVFPAYPTLRAVDGDVPGMACRELQLDIDLDELDAAASENATIQIRQTAAATG